MSPEKRPSVLMQKRYARKINIDFFPTPYWATRALCNWLVKNKEPLFDCSVWEPAAGKLHMARVLQEYFGEVQCSDLVDYGKGYPLYNMRDSLITPPLKNDSPTDWVITNPPFILAEEFIKNSRSWANRGMAMLCRTAFAEGRGRYETLFKNNPPTEMLQFVDRLTMMEGQLPTKNVKSATCFAWFVWRIPETEYYPTNLDWLQERARDWNYEPPNG